jgi:hypothetical protein
MTGNIRYRLARRRLRPAILTTNTDSSASMRSDTREPRFPHNHANHVNTFYSFDILWTRTLDSNSSILSKAPRRLDQNLCGSSRGNSQSSYELIDFLH